jgi:hypothetical protein
MQTFAVDTLADVLYYAKDQRISLSTVYGMVAERLGSDLKPADIPWMFSISGKLSATLEQHTETVRQCSASNIFYACQWLTFARSLS